MTLSNSHTDLEDESDIFAYSNALATGENISSLKTDSSNTKIQKVINEDEAIVDYSSSLATQNEVKEAN